MNIFNFFVNSNIGDIMYYLNSFLVYSVIGFIMESCLYKINSVDNYSGFMNGPVTPVYGIGVLVILLVDKLIIKKLISNRIVQIILLFVLCSFFLTLLEFIGGYILDNFFNIELWDYTNKKYNLGKYVCLEISFIWGVASLLYIFFVKKFMDRFIKRIPEKATYFFCFIFVIDLIFVIVKHFNI